MDERDYKALNAALNGESISVSNKQKIVIELREWDSMCSDGCCYTYGTDIIINGVKLEDEDGTHVHQALTAVLRHLGYDVEIR